MRRRRSKGVAFGRRRRALSATIGLVSLALVGIVPTALRAQSLAEGTNAGSSNLDVPTTKLLAIGSFTPKGTPDQWKPLLPSEVRDTVRLYLSGKIDQWYVKPDQSGVVFIMNLTDPAEARALFAKLPLGRAGLMEFQIIPLGPLSPLRGLLAGQ